MPFISYIQTIAVLLSGFLFTNGRYVCVDMFTICLNIFISVIVWNNKERIASTSESLLEAGAFQVCLMNGWLIYLIVFDTYRSFIAPKWRIAKLNG